jgi:hypothetical protein
MSSSNRSVTPVQEMEGGPSVRKVDAMINYLAPGSFVNRRFVAPGQEVNTGTYQAYPVQVRDGRPIKDRFTLDQNGFVLARHPSAVRDFFDKDEVEAVYPDEAVAAIKSLTGASHVALRGWMVRTSADIGPRREKAVGYQHQGGVQPPAGEAHVDFLPETAEAMARATWMERFPGAPPYRRFIITSLWRCFSAPPQDWPLALCDGRSVDAAEGIPNTLVVVDEIPDYATMVGPWPKEKLGPSAAIFNFNPAHRWWYFSQMNRDEVILLKFHDSDRNTAWRVPHTAFHDPSFPDANPRQSIEVRSVAYFV